MFVTLVAGVISSGCADLAKTCDNDADQCQLDQCTASIELILCRYPWGVLSVVMKHLLFNTIPVVTRRVEALLSFWDQLDTLRYIDVWLKPMSLTDLMALRFRGEVAMWVDQPTGNIRTDLQRAIDHADENNPYAPPKDVDSFARSHRTSL
ncbi:MAG: hypothetical protein IPM54_40780 [Polyangiaceae bacterium]|nr:hypothetical protein [Polyangiaceae bacterium]